MRYVGVVVGAMSVVASSCVFDVSLGSNDAAQGGHGGEGGIDLVVSSGAGCQPTDHSDSDMDGFTVAEGDCDDCDPNINPNAVEVPSPSGSGDPRDEDCDGVADEIDPPCDDVLAIDEQDPMVAARAVELCKVSTGANDWGLVSAAWVLPDGSAPPAGIAPMFHLGHGLLPDFGPNVAARRGARLLVLSSGAARRPGDFGYMSASGFNKQYESAQPAGFPQPSPSCPDADLPGSPHDGAALEIVVRTPSNANGLSFDFDFYTYEWPDYVCGQYDDLFVALLSPPPTAHPDGNISFDSMGNLVSVNNGFVDVCGCDGNPPMSCDAQGKTYPCSLGNAELIGTGFGFDTEDVDHAATSWLVTRAPVDPSSEITLRFAIYDSTDGQLDSTVLIDNVRWIAKPGTPVRTDRIK